MIHKIIVTDKFYKGNYTFPAKFHLEPPLPADRYAYLLRNEGNLEFVESIPCWTSVENGMEIYVMLPPELFPPGWTVYRDIPIKARVRVLHFGGNIFLESGVFYSNTEKLVLEVLEWQLDYHFNFITPSDKLLETKMGFSPAEPQLSISFERFFFRRWLQNRSSTMEDVRPIYEQEVYYAYLQKMAEYQKELDTYNSLVEKRKKLREERLAKIQEIWARIRNEVLPAAAKDLREKARLTLEKAGHSEFLSF